ncbi:MAG: YihY/virulence factor BrkB family protein, partial [Chlamydiota bacterium]|nr:YihY/virulence factor BrkB family protein [Chlamydiota bacterium]
LFTFLYMFMPNTKVPFKSAFIAGIIAGTLNQIVQWAYLYFQIGVAKYNAIYGSFAALPLFLIWLQISWLVVLFGAEISFAVANDETYEFEKDCLNTSRRFKNMLALRIVEMCAKNFVNEGTPLNTLQISHTIEAPIRLIRQILYELVNAKILSVIKDNGSNIESYQPAMPIEKLSIHRVIEKLENSGHDEIPILNNTSINNITATLEAFNKRLANAPENTLIIQL